MEATSEHKERQLAPDETKEILMFAKDCRKIVGLSYFTNDPANIVKAVDSYIDATQQAIAARSVAFSDENCIFRSLQLGCLWGQQLVTALGWEWTCQTDEGKELYAVASQNRALIMLPTYFVRACLTQPDMDCTAMLSFNMLVAKKFADVPENSYFKVLDHVVRIVPRR